MRNNRIKQVERLASLGFNSREIAEMTFVADSSVRYHLQNLYCKYGVTDQKKFIACFHLGRDKFAAMTKTPEFPKLI